jgi:protein ImuA
MGPVASQPILAHLREKIAEIDPHLKAALPEENRELRLIGPVDAVLGGGLACGALHELAPRMPGHLAAASGFATAAAVRAGGEVLWIATDFAMNEGGGPYGPGLDLFGLSLSRLLMLRVPRPADVLFAMEDALRCRALGCVIAELTGEGTEADLTATRRLSLAARDGVSDRVSGLGLLIRHRATAEPSAAATRWEIATAPSLPDRLGELAGGLGRTRFDLSLRKNRRGPSGRWIIEWDHHDRVFQSAVPVGVAAPAFDRPHRAAVARAG